MSINSVSFTQKPAVYFGETSPTPSPEVGDLLVVQKVSQIPDEYTPQKVQMMKDWEKAKKSKKLGPWLGAALGAGGGFAGTIGLTMLGLMMVTGEAGWLVLGLGAMGLKYAPPAGGIAGFLLGKQKGNKKYEDFIKANQLYPETIKLKESEPKK